MTHWVYGRAERPCRRCGTPVAVPRQRAPARRTPGRPGGARTASPGRSRRWTSARPGRGCGAGVNEESFGSRTKRHVAGRPGYGRGEAACLRATPSGWPAERLHEALAGRGPDPQRLPGAAARDRPTWPAATVLEVVPRGKHLLTRRRGRSDAAHALPDGRLLAPLPARRPLDRRPGLAGARRAGATPWQAVGYRLPVVELLPTADEDERRRAPRARTCWPTDWDADEALRRLRAEPTAEIGMALLDQRNLAGLGNLYRTEVLFLRGLTPWVRRRRRAGPAGAGREGPPADAGQPRATGSSPRPASLRRGEEHWVFERSRPAVPALRHAGR